MPRGNVGEVSLMLKAIHASESGEAARSRAAEVVRRLREMRLGSAGKCVEDNIEEILWVSVFTLAEGAYEQSYEEDNKGDKKKVPGGGQFS